MNPTDVYDLQYTVVALMDSTFQFWLSASFAVIIATHFAAEKLSRLVRRLVSTLYLTATILFLTRVMHVGYQFFSYNDMLIAEGLAPFPSHPAARVIISVGMLTIMVLGTIGTLYYMRRSHVT